MGIPTFPMYLIIYDHIISNILKAQLRLFIIKKKKKLTHWHNF